MKEYKLLNMRKMNNSAISAFRSISDKSALAKLFEVLNSHGFKIDSNLFLNIRDKALYFEVSDTYNIKDILKYYRNNKYFKSNIYIYWDENDIDLISYSDLITYWEEYWYDTSDESVILVDAETNNFVMITDYGLIYSSIIPENKLL